MSDGAAELKKASGWVVVLGVATIVLGCLVMGSPFVAGGAIAVYVGVMLLLGGVFEVLAAITGTSVRSRGLTFFHGLLTVVCGVFLVTKPLQALITLTLLLAIYFIMDGIGRIVLALQAKPLQGWGFVLFGGVLTLLLGLMIWRQWPLSGIWAIGLLVGVRMVVAGWAMVALGAAGRAATESP